MTAKGDDRPAGAGPDDVRAFLDIAGAASHLGVSEAFVRRIVLERRVCYFKVGKFVRFRVEDLDAFVEAGRRDPVQPWVHVRSAQQREPAHAVKRTSAAGQPRSGAGRRGRGTKS